MRKIVLIMTVIAAILNMAPQLQAKTFYLKDGEEIEFQRYWQEGGKVYVQINEDTLIDFAPEEVDMIKTAREAPEEKPLPHKTQKEMGKHVSGDEERGKTSIVTEPAPSTKPARVKAPAKNGHISGAAAIREELNDIYGRFYAAIRSCDYNEQKKYVAGKQRKDVEAMEKSPSMKQEFLKKMFKNLPETYDVTGCTVARDGKSATLRTIRKLPTYTYDNSSNSFGDPEYKDVTSEVYFKKYGDEWKITSFKDNK